MPKLTEINIKNLRGLTDLTLEDARVFNLLVGPSEIGKTTVLEGIFLGSSFGYIQGLLSVNKIRGAAMDSTESNRNAVSTLFHNITEEKIGIKTKIKNAALSYSCGIEFARLISDGNMDIPINGEQQKAFSANSDMLGVMGRVLAEGDVVGNRAFSLRIIEGEIQLKEQGRELKVNGENKEGEEIETYFPGSRFAALGSRNLLQAAANASIQKKEDQITSILQKINPRVEKFEVIAQQVYVDIGLQTKQPIYIAGSGLLEVLYTLGMLSAPKPEILLLDEIAFGLYHASLKDYLRATLRFAKEQGKQVFATTHRKDMIIALAEVVAEEEDLREDVMCYGLSRDKRGVTRAYGHNHKAIRHSIDNDIEIR